MEQQRSVRRLKGSMLRKRSALDVGCRALSEFILGACKRDILAVPMADAVMLSHRINVCLDIAPEQVVLTMRFNAL